VDNDKVVVTDDNYWDCMCRFHYIHRKGTGNYCPLCDSFEEECPDSRVNEVEGLYHVKNDEHLATKEFHEYVEPYDSAKDTMEHIEEVRSYLDTIAVAILHRKSQHDLSKLESPEKEVFDRVTPRLKQLTYGSDAYKECLDDMQEALEHHYACNRHHPEHFKGNRILKDSVEQAVVNAGMYGMTLVDIIEMFCDWCAATKRHDDGHIGKSIEVNKKRFGYDEMLAQIFANTAQNYGMGRAFSSAYRPIPNEAWRE
jgi:hypothetical protein